MIHVSHGEGEAVGGEVRHLVVTNAYPNADELYRYGFLHARVKAYLRAGRQVDVYCIDLRREDETEYVFDGVRVITGSRADYGEWIASQEYATYLVHFPVDYMIEPLEAKPEDARVILWLHGYEIESWHRRWFNFIDDPKVTANSLVQRKAHTEKQCAALRHFLSVVPDTHVVTVSEWFRRFVVEPDLAMSPANFSVIPNFVDASVFDYVPKDPSVARKVLAIRPFTSRKYATDSLVAAIVAVSDRTAEGEFEFSIFGDGPLFEEAVVPLRAMSNVHLHQGFLTQAEVAEQHKLHGILLNPTIWDSQGVSTSEAMSSGLVPVTSDVSAVPEFVTHEVTGLLTPPGDVEAMANAVIELGRDESRFAHLSRQAAQAAQTQCGWDATIARELALIDVAGSGEPVGTEPDAGPTLDWEANYRFLEAQFENALLQFKMSAPQTPPS